MTTLSSLIERLEEATGPCDLSIFNQIIHDLGETGKNDIEWSENLSPPHSPDAFASEAIYVICNSGMRFTVARQIYDRVMEALHTGLSASAAFGHAGKSKAIDQIWSDRIKLFTEFIALQEQDRVEWLATLPWIGEITKYHLAKNFGINCVKPDVHLSRLAEACGSTPNKMCSLLAQITGYRNATIDLILWRACATGLIDSRTSALRARQEESGNG